MCGFLTYIKLNINIKLDIEQGIKRFYNCEFFAGFVIINKVSYTLWWIKILILSQYKKITNCFCKLYKNKSSIIKLLFNV